MFQLDAFFVYDFQRLNSAQYAKGSIEDSAVNYGIRVGADQNDLIAFPFSRPNDISHRICFYAQVGILHQLFQEIHASIIFSGIGKSCRSSLLILSDFSKVQNIFLQPFYIDL